MRLNPTYYFYVCYVQINDVYTLFENFTDGKIFLEGVLTCLDINLSISAKKSSLINVLFILQDLGKSLFYPGWYN